MERDINWKDDIYIARQLCYHEKAIQLLELESNPEARQRILHDARKGIYDVR